MSDENVVKLRQEKTKADKLAFLSTLAAGFDLQTYTPQGRKYFKNQFLNIPKCGSNEKAFWKCRSRQRTHCHVVFTPTIILIHFKYYSNTPIAIRIFEYLGVVSKYSNIRIIELNTNIFIILWFQIHDIAKNANASNRTDVITALCAKCKSKCLGI